MRERVSEHNGKWRAAGLEFDSKEAADLYLESRAKGSDSSLFALWKGLSTGKRMVLGLAVLVTVLVVVDVLTPKKLPSEVALSPADKLMEKSEGVATLINLNGQLCAKVTHIRHRFADQFEVTCIRYRDGTGMATYEVDLNTGLVK